MTDRGFAHDREWMVVDAEGRFLTQREEPRLALVRPQVTATALQLEAPEMPRLDLALEARALATENSEYSRTISVWGFVGPAVDQGDVAAAWFSRFLGRTAFLVRWRSDVLRLSDPTWTDGIPAPNRFSDGFPILVLSEASLADLNARRLPAPPLPMNRFRPNLVVAGVPAYAEDAFLELKTGETELRLVKPCERCQITTTDQNTGVANLSDPLKTLAAYRRRPGRPGVVFGQNAILARGVGASIQVGAKVTFDRARPRE